MHLGSCPRNKFWFAIMLCFGMEKNLVSTLHTGYLADILSNPLMWSNWTEGSTFTLRTKRATSSIFTLPSPTRLKASLLLTNRILMSIPFNTKRSWKHKSRWGRPIMTTCFASQAPLLSALETLVQLVILHVFSRIFIPHGNSQVRLLSSWTVAEQSFQKRLDMGTCSWTEWLDAHLDSHQLDWRENKATNWRVLHRHHTINSSVSATSLGQVPPPPPPPPPGLRILALTCK